MIHMRRDESGTVVLIILAIFFVISIENIIFKRISIRVPRRLYNVLVKNWERTKKLHNLGIEFSHFSGYF